MYSSGITISTGLLQPALGHRECCFGLPFWLSTIWYCSSPSVYLVLRNNWPQTCLSVSIPWIISGINSGQVPPWYLVLWYLEQFQQEPKNLSISHRGFYCNFSCVALAIFSNSSTHSNRSRKQRICTMMWILPTTLTFLWKDLPSYRWWSCRWFSYLFWLICCLSFIFWGNVIFPWEGCCFNWEVLSCCFSRED